MFDKKECRLRTNASYAFKMYNLKNTVGNDPALFPRKANHAAINLASYRRLPRSFFELVKEEEHSKLENSYSFLSLPRPRCELPRNYSVAIVLSGHGMEFAPLLRHGACEVAVAMRALWRSGHLDLDN